ncbi:MAG: phosphatase PAP2 family protein [Francisellaceae bacterium]|jgi:hypothetical protein|nr:phosphatase PAP2 family protein [Francisellaceae bacterium]
MIYSPTQLKTRFRTTLVLFTLAIAIWKTPFLTNLVYQIDSLIYFVCNKLIGSSMIWTKFVGFLNHKHENWLNLVFMLTINFLMIASSKPYARKKIFWQIIYFWFFFQFVIYLTHFVFQDTLAIRRVSPSNIFIDTHNSISTILMSDSIKEASVTSFPAGHTLVAIYWCLFSLSLKPGVILQRCIFLVTGLLCINRLLTGAHWGTDVIFTINLGFFFHYVSCHPFFYGFSDLTTPNNVAFINKP